MSSIIKGLLLKWNNFQIKPFTSPKPKNFALAKCIVQWSHCLQHCFFKQKGGTFPFLLANKLFSFFFLLIESYHYLKKKKKKMKIILLLFIWETKAFQCCVHALWLLFWHCVKMLPLCSRSQITVGVSWYSVESVVSASLRAESKSLNVASEQV